MRAMGIDMGTTTISLIMADGENGELLGSKTIAHQAFLEGSHAKSRIQDADKLWRLTRQAAAELIQEYGVPDSIGLTGQMHGMLYVNREGAAVSPLYTWQDGSGDLPLDGGRSSAALLKETGGAAAAGYGLVTHYYLQRTGQVPPEAVKMTTISDYIAMKLCGNSEPVMGADMAASWGCFDLEKTCFLEKELAALGVEVSYLPRVVPGHGCVGRTAGVSGQPCAAGTGRPGQLQPCGDAAGQRPSAAGTGRPGQLQPLESTAGQRQQALDPVIPAGIPVTVSWGDNQASVLGSVRSLEDTVLVNIGTGSQVSFATEQFYHIRGSIELRPCTDSLYLMAGSGLCGGRAYAMLEEFYREAAGLAGGQQEGALYEAMERQGRAFLKEYGPEAAWSIRTTFSGTRSDPQERGSIQGISVENFHPGAMTVGMLRGILTELHEMYEEMCRMTGRRALRLVGSGNGLRRNSLMQELAQELFGMKMDIPLCQEEAAYGAALQALAGAGLGPTPEEMQQKIRYI